MLALTSSQKRAHVCEDGGEAVGRSAPAQRTSFPLFSQSQNSAYTDPPSPLLQTKARLDTAGEAVSSNAPDGKGDDVVMNDAAHLDAEVFANVDPSGQQQQNPGEAGAGSQEGGVQNGAGRAGKSKSGDREDEEDEEDEEEEAREEVDTQVLNETQSLLAELE
ncbi:MAG: hypothetical protein BJ554DRAFT_5845 [Olpidium bornovanus]|uniref:Uncharacterized protein n=1 Tax=Olpidium bornovanus TaxID=278681 RepID=A0A8H7ZYX7_9FUNG|nr:MAG: hypothetical protein BJ554DRAFT_5845 [Olpidium bornovanus]